jgi:hypothetical protein
MRVSSRGGPLRKMAAARALRADGFFDGTDFGNYPAALSGNNQPCGQLQLCWCPELGGESREMLLYEDIAG